MEMDPDRESTNDMRPPSFTPSNDEEVYGRTERQLAFKLLAAHAMVDAEFYRQLHEDPEAAAALLHIRLNEEDVHYIRDTVDWSVLDQFHESVREALRTDAVVRSLW
jgi:hypothetical protein